MAILIWPNRAASPCYSHIFDDVGLYIEHFWSSDRAECWDLRTLAVSPDYAGLGHGRALVKWGLDQAAKEGVCASVTTAPGKEKFYQNCGFDLQEGRGGQGEGNPLADVPGGLIFWKLADTPKSVERNET